MQLENKKIVIADHSGHMRRTIRSMVRSFGVKDIIEVEDGALALEAIEANSPDILLTEIHMPIFDGLELTEMIRSSSSSFSSIPVISISADSRKSTIEKARDTGITEFLIKPLSANDLFLRIRNAIDYPRQFVVTESFVGPDRRRLVDIHFNGIDRRNADQFAIDD